MRVLYAALALTLVALPASAQKPTTQPRVQQKAAPPAIKGNKATLLIFEERVQQYADRIASAADKGEGMAMVNYLVMNCSQSLHGGEVHLKALQPTATGAEAKSLAVIAQHHATAQKAFDALRAELNVKDRNPSRATVMRLAYQLSDEAMLAQGKKPPKHPIIKAEPATRPSSPSDVNRPKPDQPKG